MQTFANEPITELVARFDFFVIDHPSISEVAAHDLFLPLDQHLSADFLVDQLTHNVGASHVSYQYDGHQWALAIDATTVVVAARPDVLDQHGHAVPITWDETLKLTRAGLVVFAGLPLNCFMHWYALYIKEGQIPFVESNAIVA